MMTSWPLLFPLAFMLVPNPSHASAPSCTQTAGTKVPAVPMPIEHIVIIMQENHSFDNYFGRLNQPQYYGSAVDGPRDEFANNDRKGQPVHPHHEETLCPKDPGHRWNDMHKGWNGGRNDGWVQVNGPDSIGYYDQRDLPFYYALANEFAIGDRYFCSAMTQTFPNRFYLMTGTSFGHIANIVPKGADQYPQPTIFDLLDRYNIAWRYYGNGKGYLSLFQPTFRKDRAKQVPLDEYQRDLASDHFPQVAFVESNYEEDEDEHPDEDIQVGQAWVAKRISALTTSRYWKDSVLFLTYDENGGFYDHVAPPQACAPDHIPPMLKPNSLAGDFAQYGFRVPFLAISPYAKHHYVSHVTYDHTSILKFIETKFGLPSLTNRDANADAMLDLFDFGNPQNLKFDIRSIPPAVIEPTRACGKGIAPPQTNGPHGT